MGWVRNDRIEVGWLGKNAWMGVEMERVVISGFSEMTWDVELFALRGKS